MIVFGKNGQVARALARVYPDARFISSMECDFSQPQNVRNFLSSLSIVPQVIINAAAYTAVDLAETEREKACNINAIAPRILAEYCKTNVVKLFHYSTDYVFSGLGIEPFRDDDLESLQPCNYYGQTKLDGEKFILESGCEFYILRVSWIYDEFGKNFVKTMLRLFAEREELSVVGDQIGSPTYAGDIANITKTILDGDFDAGMYHFTNDGFISWYEFACKIMEVTKRYNPNLKIRNIKEIKTTDYPTPATRPLNSRLDKTKLAKYLVPWEESLIMCIRNIHA